MATPTNKKTAPPPGHPSAASRSEGQGQASKSDAEVASEPLYKAFPVNTVVELTLNRGEVVRGLVYTTDEVSNSVVLKKSLPHTTLTSEIRIVNASSIVEKKTIDTKSKASAAGKAGPGPSSAEGGALDGFEEEELAIPLPNVGRKALEERERRAIRLAEESFSHINQKASPEGQVVFDKLLKACNEVVWRGESILVLNQIRVDPPYGKEDCKLVGTSGGLNEGSLDRVKKIVAATSDR